MPRGRRGGSTSRASHALMYRASSVSGTTSRSASRRSARIAVTSSTRSARCVDVLGGLGERDRPRAVR